MNDIKEFEIENRSELVDAFCDTNEKDYFEFIQEMGWLKAMWLPDIDEIEYNLVGISDAKDAFAIDRNKDYIRFVECEFGSRGAE